MSAATDILRPGVILAMLLAAMVVGGCQSHAKDPHLMSMTAPAGTILIAPLGGQLAVVEDTYRLRKLPSYRLGADSVIIARRLFEQTIRAMIERRGLEEEEPQRYDMTHREKEMP